FRAAVVPMSAKGGSPSRSGPMSLASPIGSRNLAGRVMEKRFGGRTKRTAGAIVPALWLAGCAAALAQAPDAPAPDVPATLPDVGSLLPRDLSPWGMFLNADVIVKAVMVGLVIASLVTWTVALAKGLEVMMAKRRLRRGLRVLAQARSLADATRQLD